MKIIVTADTHMTDNNNLLPSRFVKELKNADLIIHAGDWKTMDVYHTLAKYSEVIGVYGNIDNEEIKDQFSTREILNVHGHKIGIVHGHGEKKTTEKRALEAFDDNDVDVIIFGHSHIPMMRYFNKTLLFNPGSPTYKRKLPYYSFGILEIDEEIRGEIIFFSEKS
ncbi:metallophosphoesterase family protein [Virgibacillus doumboii]|uniref:metallophosphoesterase family protein n=1 Tax=Virgibacillus doumboii TaxID=2697503 RepID=UPI0013DEEB09|nr:metallophosphoesterase family protein [Virgibacillus doumboii]